MERRRRAGEVDPRSAAAFSCFGVAVDGEQDKRKPRETAGAQAAFADYVALGPGRSLEKLAESYRSRSESVPTRQVSTLKVWSTTHDWQARLAAMEAERLAAGQEIRTALYLRALMEYDRRTDDGLIENAAMDDIHAIYDRVRPSERANADLGINLTATVRLIGVDPEDV